jgi:hypothetical protein
MINKNTLLFALSILTINIDAIETINIKTDNNNRIVLDKNISNNEYLSNILVEMRINFEKYHKEFNLYKKDYIFSNPEHIKFKKNIDILEKSFNILKFNLLDKLSITDEYLSNRLNILFNEYKVNIEYYKEYNILMKLTIDKDIEMQRSIVIKNLKDKYMLIDIYIKDIKFYTQNIKKNIVNHKVNPTIIDNNKRIYQSELDMLLHNLLKIHKRDKIIEKIEEHEINLKIINNLLKISINKDASDCLINVNKNINELYENYIEYNKIILEKNNESELKFILTNIDMSFNLTYEYIDKCKSMLNE